MPIESVARGYKSTILMDFETSFGEAPSTHAGVRLPINTIGLNVSRNKNSAQTLTGRRDPVEPFDGDVEISGDVTVPVDTRGFGYWLKLLLGAPTTSGSGAPYTHVFKVGDNNPSAIIQEQFGTDPLTFGKFSGVKAASMSLTVGGDEELVATVSLVGRDVEYVSENYNANADLVVMKRLNNFQASLKKGSSTLATVTQMSITIDNGLDTSIRTIGGEGKLYDIPEGIMNVSGSMTELFTSLDTLNAAKNSTELSFELSVSIDANNKLQLLFPEVQLQFQGPESDGPGGILTEYPFVAYFADDSTNNSVVVATLVNDVANYD